MKWAQGGYPGDAYAKLDELLGSDVKCGACLQRLKIVLLMVGSSFFT
ncbi:hypothetical protein [Amphibacillus cookii]|nr:hypothetical protein [Amphibacillus cookii]MBM7541236.1 hypothetical protein [Amphibacillus cookii]